MAGLGGLRGEGLRVVFKENLLGSLDLALGVVIGGQQLSQRVVLHDWRENLLDLEELQLGLFSGGALLCFLRAQFRGLQDGGLDKRLHLGTKEFGDAHY